MEALATALSIGGAIAKFVLSAILNNDQKAVDRVLAVIPKEDKRHEEIRLELQRCSAEAHKLIEARLSGKA